MALRSTRAVTPSGDENIDSLEAKLLDSLIKWPAVTGRSTWFLPESRRKEIVTPDSIFESLDVDRNKKVKLHLAHKYHRQASRLFALLVLIGKASSFSSFMDEDLSDADFPFTRLLNTDHSRRGTLLHSSQHADKEILTMFGWPTRDIENFESEQWTVFVPFFDKNKVDEVVVYHPSRIFPFTKDDEMADETHEPAGAYGSVWKVRIHPAHHNLTDNSGNPIEAFAIKRLHSKAKAPFEQEHNMLRRLSNETNLPFIDLCAAYTWKGEHYILFSWADASLTKYWEKVKLPKFTRGSLLWMLKQCKDLAFAIECMHNYKSPEHFKAVDLKRQGRDHTPYADSDKLGQKTDFIFAQHGDIKPDNILWAHNRERGDPQGQLMIADFGLSAFHKEDSKSKFNGPRGFHTFSPPECALESSTSLQYDIWSLGAVFLFFITWMSSGNNGLQDFSKRLNEPDHRFPETYIETDLLYSVQVDGDTKKPVVKKGVIDWILELQSRRRSCRMFDDFLDIIKNEMLLTEPKDRIRSNKLYEKLHNIYGKASIWGDSDYLSHKNPAKPDPSELAPHDGVELPVDNSMFSEDG